MGVPIDKLNREHPDYALYKDAWTEFDLMNSGGVRFKLAAQQFLVKRPKELFDVYSERLRRLTYQNIIGTVLGWYGSALFKLNPQVEIARGDPNPAARKRAAKAGNPAAKPGTPAAAADDQPSQAIDDWYDDFQDNCDRGGTLFVDLFRIVFKYCFLFQKAYVLVDLPHPEVEPATRADEKALGLDQPYLVLYSPMAAINWANDETGKLKWIVFRTQEETGDFLGNPEIVTRWYYFDRTDYQIYENRVKVKTEGGKILLYNSAGQPIDDNSRQAELIADGQHALATLNRVPVQRIEVPEELWMSNRVYLQLLDHFNQDNSYAWALFNANLAMPIVFSDKTVHQLTMSEAAFLQLGEKDKFEWTEPGGKSFVASQARLNALRQEIYRTLYLQAQGRNDSAIATAQSGYSKEIDLIPSNEVLNRFGDIIRTGMQNVGQDVSDARADKMTWDVYGFRFETTPFVQTIAKGQQMQSLGVFDASPTLEKEAFKTIAGDFLEDRNDDLKQTVMDEIDSYPSAAERDQAEQQKQQQQFTNAFNKRDMRLNVNDEEASLSPELATARTRQ